MNPNEPLRIFILDAHSRGGGQVSYVTRLAVRLTAMGHHVTIGCRPGSVLVQAAEEAGADCLDVFRFVRGLRLRGWLHDLRQLKRFLQSFQPDIIHVNGSQDHWIAALCNRWMGMPHTLLRSRHNTYRVKNSLPNRLLNRRWTQYQIVVCEAVRQTLAAQPIFNADALCTIHNGVDAERFQPNPEARERIRGTLGNTEAHTVCGIVGRLVKAKGHTYLLQAAAQLHDRYPNLRLLFVGEGVLRDALEQEAATLGVGEITHFAGFQNDMPDWVQAFDIGVQPSIDCDTSSFSLKELMAAGKPVIASDYGGLREILDDGVEGYIVPAGTVTPLAEALEKLLQAPERCPEMGASGRARVLRAFTLEHFAEATVQAYHDAMAVHRESAAP